jgi:hypothetical protein
MMTAADHLLRGPFGAVKRFALREGEPDSQQHVKDMSFAQELVMMPPFPRESAVMHALLAGTFARHRLSSFVHPPVGGLQAGGTRKLNEKLRPYPHAAVSRQALPAVVKGIHTKIISNSSLSGSDQTSDPLCGISVPSGQASFPETVSASRPAVPPILPFRPDPQQLKEAGSLSASSPLSP